MLAGGSVHEYVRYPIEQEPIKSGHVVQKHEKKAVSDEELFYAITKYKPNSVKRAIARKSPLTHRVIKTWINQEDHDRHIAKDEEGIAVRKGYFSQARADTIDQAYSRVATNETIKALLAGYVKNFSEAPAEIEPALWTRFAQSLGLSSRESDHSELARPIKHAMITESYLPVGITQKGISALPDIDKILDDIKLQAASVPQLDPVSIARREEQIAFYEAMYRENPRAVPSKPSMLQQAAIKRLAQQ